MVLVPNVRRLLENHLAHWLGQWPPTDELVVTTAPSRVEPGWDGQVHPVVGVSSPDGTVISVPPSVVAAAAQTAETGGLAALGAELGALIGRPGHRLGSGVFRWSDAPTPASVLPDAGTWVAAADPRVPHWLHPFGGDVLVAWDDAGDYAAGVGIKRHDRFGHELAVGTEKRYSGQGLGRRLVAQAARRVVADGRVPTYLHDPRNLASGKVADAAGFPDRGWKILGLWP